MPWPPQLFVRTYPEGVSRWREIAEQLRRQIEDGTYPPGSRLPTEAEMTERYHVGRTALRQALARLTADGLLTARPRHGTFVRHRPVRLPISRYAAMLDPDRADAGLGPWETMCKAQGIDGRTEVVGVARLPAPEPVANRLDLDAGAQVVHRLRHMWADDRLAQVQDAYVPLAIAQGTPLAGD